MCDVIDDAIDVFLVSLLLTLKGFHTLFRHFHCWIELSNYSIAQTTPDGFYRIKNIVLAKNTVKFPCDTAVFTLCIFCFFPSYFQVSIFQIKRFFNFWMNFKPFIIKSLNIFKNFEFYKTNLKTLPCSLLFSCSRLLFYADKRVW